MRLLGMEYCAPNPPIPQSPNSPVPESPIQWNTIKALGLDKIANRHKDRHINTMNWPVLRTGPIENFYTFIFGFHICYIAELLFILQTIFTKVFDKK